MNSLPQQSSSVPAHQKAPESDSLQLARLFFAAFLAFLALAILVAREGYDSELMMAIYRPRLVIADAGKSFELLKQHFDAHGLKTYSVELTPDTTVSLPPFANACQVARCGNWKPGSIFVLGSGMPLAAPIFVPTVVNVPNSSTTLSPKMPRLVMPRSPCRRMLPR